MGFCRRIVTTRNGRYCDAAQPAGSGEGCLSKEQSHGPAGPIRRFLRFGAGQLLCTPSRAGSGFVPVVGPRKILSVTGSQLLNRCGSTVGASFDVNPFFLLGFTGSLGPSCQIICRTEPANRLYKRRLCPTISAPKRRLGAAHGTQTATKGSSTDDETA